MLKNVAVDDFDVQFYIVSRSTHLYIFIVFHTQVRLVNCGLTQHSRVLVKVL